MVSFIKVLIVTALTFASFAVEASASLSDQAANPGPEQAGSSFSPDTKTQQREKLIAKIRTVLEEQLAGLDAELSSKRLLTRTIRFISSHISKNERVEHDLSTEVGRSVFSSSDPRKCVCEAQNFINVWQELGVSKFLVLHGERGAGTTMELKKAVRAATAKALDSLNSGKITLPLYIDLEEAARAHKAAGSPEPIPSAGDYHKYELEDVILYALKSKIGEENWTTLLSELNTDSISYVFFLDHYGTSTSWPCRVALNLSLFTKARYLIATTPSLLWGGHNGRQNTRPFYLTDINLTEPKKSDSCWLNDLAPAEEAPAEKASAEEAPAEEAKHTTNEEKK